MGKKRQRVISLGLFALGALLLLTATGCKKKESEQPIQVSARFTSPVSIQGQPSSKCIACHTQVGPINNLATPVSAAAETGG